MVRARAGMFAAGYRFQIVIVLCAALVVAIALSGWTGRRDATAGAPLMGDVNCSGSVNSLDAALVLQYAAALISDLDCTLNAQASGGATITSVDASLILQYTARLIDHLPPILSYEGRLTLVRGVEADCLGIETGGVARVLLFPQDFVDLAIGIRVKVVGYMDPFASFCGITPILHNLSVEPIN